VTARMHPYDMVFAMPELEGTAFPAIRNEAEERGVDLHDHERVLLLEGMGELMRSLLPPDAATPAFAQFAPIVTHAFHYWLEGKQTFAIDEAALRSMIDGTGASARGSWSHRHAPVTSAYRAIWFFPASKKVPRRKPWMVFSIF
jgi:hypothetical protein